MGIRVRNTFGSRTVLTKVRAAIGLYADTSAKKMEAEAKDDAIWIDRTSNARGSIQGDSGWRGDNAVISISGNMDYFPYLELCNEKKYAILKPTIDKNTAEILKGYQRLVK